MLLANYPVGARGGRRVHREYVGARQQFGQADRLDTALDHHDFLDERVVGDDV